MWVLRNRTHTHTHREREEADVIVTTSKISMGLGWSGQGMSGPLLLMTLKVFSNNEQSYQCSKADESIGSLEGSTIKYVNARLCFISL